jgi:hypothetical protein
VCSVTFNDGSDKTEPVKADMQCYLSTWMESQSETFLHNVFCKFCDQRPKSALHSGDENLCNTLRISKPNFFAAFDTLDLDHNESLFDEMDSDNANGLSWEQFLHATQIPSILGQWVQSMALWKPLADILRLTVKSREAGLSFSDPLHAVSGLTDEEIDTVISTFQHVARAVLRKEMNKLRNTFQTSRDDENECTESTKFQVQTTTYGNIDDFHSGLSGRVGTYFPWHLPK